MPLGWLRRVKVACVAWRAAATMATVGEHETLARVREDIDAGRVALARQRLRGLVGSYPQRLDLREQLAELYRQDGIVSQAGRWSYLGEAREPKEMAAFEREYRDPVARMRAVAWRGPEDASGEEVRQRLADVRADAERAVGHPLSWDESAAIRPAETWVDRLIGVAAFAVLMLILLGGIAFFIEGIKTVARWFSG
jgi:hypothetical protein